MASKLILEGGSYALRKFVETSDDLSMTSTKNFQSTRTGLFMKLQILVTIIESDTNITSDGKAWVLNAARMERLASLGLDIETEKMERFDNLNIRKRCINLFDEMYPKYMSLRDTARLAVAEGSVMDASYSVISEVKDLALQRDVLKHLPAADTLIIANHSESNGDDEDNNEDTVTDTEQHLRTVLADIRNDPRLQSVDKDLLLNPQTKEWQSHLAVRFEKYKIQTTQQKLTGAFDDLKWDFVVLTSLLQLLYDRFCVQHQLSMDIVERNRRIEVEIQRYQQQRPPVAVAPTNIVSGPFPAAVVPTTTCHGDEHGLQCAKTTAPVVDASCGVQCVVS